MQFLFLLNKINLNKNYFRYVYFIIYLINNINIKNNQWSLKTPKDNLYGLSRFLKTDKKKVNEKILRLFSVEHLYNRYEKYMTEDAIPPEPTREQELKYLGWLEKSFSEDPIVTLHPKMYSAGPYRLHYRYRKETQKEYRKIFLKNFLLSVGFTWPLIILLIDFK